MKRTHINMSGTARSLLAALLALSVSFAFLAGCGKNTVRDTEDEDEPVKTSEEETEKTTEVTTTTSEEPTPTPTPPIPHMDAPEVDTTAPMWLNLPESVSIQVDSEFDINKYVGNIDDCDSDVDIQIEGEVDT